MHIWSKNPNEMKKHSNNIINKSINEIDIFQVTMKSLQDQISRDFYLTRSSIKHFRALLASMETDGMLILQKKFKNNSYHNIQQSISHIITSFYKAWDKFKDDQITLCSDQFIQPATSYIKEHLKACNKIIAKIIDDRNDDIKISNILTHSGKLSKLQTYNNTFLNEFTKASEGITNDFAALREDITTLQDRAYSTDENQIDFSVIKEQCYQFRKFYSSFNSQYSILFKPFQSYDKNKMKSLLNDCQLHIDKCSFCLRPISQKDTPKYNPWNGDHLSRWNILINKADTQFNLLFKIYFKYRKDYNLNEYSNDENDINDDNNQYKYNSDQDNEKDDGNSNDGDEDDNDKKYNSSRRKHRHSSHRHRRHKNDQDETSNSNKTQLVISDELNIVANDTANNEDTIPIEEEEEEAETTSANDNSNSYINREASIEKNNDNDNDDQNRYKKLLIKLSKYKSLYENEKKKNELYEARIRSFSDDQEDLRRFRESNTALASENAQLKTKVSELENEIARLNSNFDLSRQQKASLDDALKAELSRATKESSDKTAEIEKLCSTILQLESNLRKSQSESEIKGQKESEYEERIIGLQQQLKTAEDENLQLRKKNEKKKEYKQQLLQREKQIGELNQILKTKENELLNSKLSIEKLTKINTQSMLNYQKYLSMINPNSNPDDLLALEKARAALAKISSEKVEKEEEIRLLKKEIASQETVKEDLNRQIKALKENESSLMDELKSKDDKILNLSEKVNESSLNLSSLSTLKRRMKQTQGENDELREKIDKLNQDSAKMSEKVRQIELMQVKLDDSNEKLIKKKQKIAKLKQQIQIKDNTIAQFKETIRNTKDSLNT